MLQLARQASDPVWLDLLPGVRVQVRPASPAAMIAARNRAGKAFGEGADEPEAREDRQSDAVSRLVRSLAHHAILAWEGIGDTDGRPALVTPETIDALMDVWPAFDAFDRQYVGPYLEGGREKNASSSAPDGTSGAAPNTAAPAT